MSPRARPAQRGSKPAARAAEAEQAAPPDTTDPCELEQELDWLARVVDWRFERYFSPGDGPPQTSGAELPPPPALGRANSPWARLVQQTVADDSERLALVLALAPHLRPQLLDAFHTRNSALDRPFTEFGGQRTEHGFEPTGETLAFLLGGASIAARARVCRLLDSGHPLARCGAVRALRAHPDQPLLRAPLQLGSEQLALVLTGQTPPPVLGVDFPAQRITTALQWKDLVLHPSTLKQIQELETFITHGATLLHDWGMAARLRPGYRALFHGPPGTGKSMSAALLGKLTGRDVYRIDLSLVVSKYIGETEKNLGRVFDRAQRRGWILFFDEAEALFGKRSETKDAHDRYANQEVAYLLQRLEVFDGIVILASNLRDNLDEAFARRFESIVYFPPPRAAERLLLWKQGLPKQAKLDAGVELEAVAQEHELTGGSIMNIIRQVCLASIADGRRPITAGRLQQAILRELAKEGR